MAFMKKTTSVFTLLLAGLLLFSCKKNEHPANLTCIPKDADLVLCVNVDSLILKSEIKDYKQSPINTLLSQDVLTTDPTVRAVAANPEKSGVDFKQIFAFTTKTNVAGVSLALKDEDDFFERVKELKSLENITTEIENASEYMILPLKPKDSTFVIWNDDKAMILSHCAKYKAIEIFKTKSEDCILAQKDFADFYKQRRDIAVWGKSTAFNKQMSAYMQNPYLSLSTEVSDSTYNHLNMSFEQGAIKISNQVTPLDLAKVDAAKYFATKPDAELVKYVPANALFLTKMSINKAVVSKQLDGQQEELAYLINPSQLNAIKSWDGDMVVAVLKSNEYSLPQVVMGVSVANSSVADLLLKDLFGGRRQVKLGAYTAIPQQGFTVFVAQKGKYLFATNNESSVKAFVTGRAVAGSAAELSDIKNAPAYLYMNLDINSYPILIKTYLQTLGLDDKFNAALLLKEVRMSYDAASATSYFNVSLKNTQGNSLAVIANELGKIN